MKRFWDFIMGVISFVIVARILFDYSTMYDSFVMDWDRYNHDRMWR